MMIPLAWVKLIWGEPLPEKSPIEYWAEAGFENRTEFWDHSWQRIIEATPTRTPLMDLVERLDDP